MVYQFWSILSIPFPEEVIPLLWNADIADIADIVVITRFPNQAIAIIVVARSTRSPPG
jgi:hypothetical protein